jgi:hypothetical protein
VRATGEATGLPCDGRLLRYCLVATDRAGNVSEQTPVPEITPVDTVAPDAPALRVSHLDNTPHTLKINWDTRTAHELRIEGVRRVYRSTAGTLGDDPELIGTVAENSAPTWPPPTLTSCPRSTAPPTPTRPC